MRIMPPQESFTLCHYTANLLRELPIDGFYQMKASNESVDKFKNNIENKRKLPVGSNNCRQVYR